MDPILRESPFIKACFREKTPYTPIWLMRQAGRYMQEYREVRSKTPFLELCRNPELACEVTTYAANRLGADAAIIFSDILLILVPMELDLVYTAGDGPEILNPIQTVRDVDQLKPIEPEESLDFLYRSLKLTRSALPANLPLIGFSGAPFTLAAYAIEGGSSKQFEKTRAFMKAQPVAWDKLMTKLAMAISAYLKAQIPAGAQALQLFDSWAGHLTPEEYRHYVKPYSKKIADALPKDIPLIHFGTGTTPFLEDLSEAAGEVIGVDASTSLTEAWPRIGNKAIQGNLDPKILLEPISVIREHVKRILEEANGRPGHIFNLGHGVLQQTPVDHAIALIEMVHELSTVK